MNWPLRMVLVTWLGTWGVACEAGSSRGGGLAEQLDEHVFLSQSVEGHELVEGTDIRLSFDDAEVSAYAGCNHMSGTFTIVGGVLRIHGLSTTEIGCDEDLHAQDQWLRELLTGSPRITFDDSELTLETDDGTLTLLDRELASPDRPLVGTHWIGNGTGDGNAITFGPGSELVTIDFEEDGTFAAFTSCQSGSGTFTAGPTTIELDEVGYNEEPCANPAFEGLATQVKSVLASGVIVELEIEESNLTLERGGALLLFRADE